MQVRQPSRDVERDAAVEPRVWPRPAARVERRPPPEPPTRVTGERGVQVAVVHELGDDHRVPALDARPDERHQVAVAARAHEQDLPAELLQLAGGGEGGGVWGGGGRVGVGGRGGMLERAEARRGGGRGRAFPASPPIRRLAPRHPGRARERGRRRGGLGLGGLRRGRGCCREGRQRLIEDLDGNFLHTIKRALEHLARGAGAEHDFVAFSVLANCDRRRADLPIIVRQPVQATDAGGVPSQQQRRRGRRVALARGGDGRGERLGVGARRVRAAEEGLAPAKLAAPPEQAGGQEGGHDGCHRECNGERERGELAQHCPVFKAVAPSERPPVDRKPAWHGGGAHRVDGVASRGQELERWWGATSRSASRRTTNPLSPPPPAPW